MNRRTFTQSLGAGALLALTGSGPALAASPRLAVIVGKSSSFDNLSLATLRNIFLAQPTSENGVRLVPFNSPPNSPERVLFDRRVLGMDPDEVARRWVDQRIRGNPGPPRTIAGAKLLRQVVARLPGAIAYLNPEDLDGTVKALTVGGYDYTHKDYPIR
jgi:hypothetical protein